MLTKRVTEQAKEFYEKGYESGTAREQIRALEQEYKELTGKYPPRPEKPVQGNQNQFFVSSEAPP